MKAGIFDNFLRGHTDPLTPCNRTSSTRGAERWEVKAAKARSYCRQAHLCKPANTLVIQNAPVINIAPLCQGVQKPSFTTCGVFLPA